MVNLKVLENNLKIKNYTHCKELLSERQNKKVRYVKDIWDKNIHDESNNRCTIVLQNLNDGLIILLGGISHHFHFVLHQ